MIILSQKTLALLVDTHTAAPAVRSAWVSAIAAIVCLGLLVMESAQAIDIPALPAVEPSITAVNPALAQLRERLLEERKALLARTNDHNKICGAVESGSAADASCTRAYPALEAAINSHIQASKQYNDNYLAAVNLAASQKPAPHTDTSAVDARNVPSGLPKALDNAITTAYSSAPPGVSDRVRKGFQAVMDRDWKVAKAWFEDALHRDPNNARLKRLVALTENGPSTAAVDSRNEPVGLGGSANAKSTNAASDKTKSASVSTANPNIQLPDPNDIYLMFPGLKKMEDKETLDYLFGFDPYPTASKAEKTN